MVPVASPVSRGGYSSRLIGGSASYLLSVGVPLLLGLVLIPPTLAVLGASGFGLLTLYWAVLTFLGNFDFGVGQTLTRLLAVEGGQTLSHQESGFASAAFVIQAMIGAALVLVTLVGLFFINPEQRQEILVDHVWTLVLVLITFPTLSVMAGIRAALEAKKDFHAVSVISLATGISQFAIPWFLAIRGYHIDAIVMALALTRICIGAALFNRLVSRLGYRPGKFSEIASEARMVWKAGSWIAVSSFVNPTLLYVDRMILPFFFPLHALANYILPLEFLLRLMIAPVVVNRIAYPYLHQTGSEGGRLRALTYSRIAVAMSVWGAFMLLATLVAPRLLALWLGESFAERSSAITQIILVALSFSGLTYLSTNMLIAVNRSSFEPKVQLIILPLFVLFLLWAMSMHSLKYVALALLARVVVHCLALLLAIRTWIPETRRIASLQLVVHVSTAALVLFICL